MSQNYYLYEILAEIHRQDMLHEAEQQRLVAQLPKQHNGVRHLAGTYGVLVLVLVLVIAGALTMHVIASSGLHLIAGNHWTPQAMLQPVIARWLDPQVLHQAF